MEKCVLCGKLLPVGRLQAVPHHADGADLHLGAEMLQLFPQEGDIDLHVVVLRVGLIAPDFQQQLFLGDDHLPVQHQHLHHVELLPAEPHGSLAAGEGEGGLLQPQVPVFQGVRLPQLRLAPGQSPDAGQQLLGLKGLCQIVIGAAVQSLHPVREIGAIAKEHGILFHTDAVQAFGQIPIQVDDLNIDMLSASGHKLNGPKGIGFLYIKENTKLHPLFFGGSQQRKLRPGTENIPYIVGLATACQMHCENRAQKREHLWQMKMELLSRLRQKQIKFSINGSEAASAPHIVSLCFPEISLSGFLTSLDLDGVCVSGGSACTSGSVRGSHVLIAMYQETDARVLSSVRFSFGIYTDLTDIKRVVVSIEKYIQRTKCLKG